MLPNIPPGDSSNCIGGTQDLQEWACTALGVPTGLNQDTVLQSVLLQMPACNWVPVQAHQDAIDILAEAHLGCAKELPLSYLQSRATSFSRLIENFAERFFEMPPEERRERWARLSKLALFWPKWKVLLTRLESSLDLSDRRAIDDSSNGKIVTWYFSDPWRMCKRVLSDQFTERSIDQIRDDYNVYRIPHKFSKRFHSNRVARSSTIEKQPRTRASLWQVAAERVEVAFKYMLSLLIIVYFLFMLTYPVLVSVPWSSVGEWVARSVSWSSTDRVGTDGGAEHSALEAGKKPKKWNFIGVDAREKEIKAAVFRIAREEVEWSPETPRPLFPTGYKSALSAGVKFTEQELAELRNLRPLQKPASESISVNK